MGNSQNGAAFFYWAHKRRKTAEEARRVKGKGSSLSDGMVIFLFIAFLGFVGATIQIFSYAVLQVTEFLNAATSLVPFL